MKLIECTNERAPEVLAILNEAIVNSTAVYDYEPRTLPMMLDWFDSKKVVGHPVIGTLADDGSLSGFASYGVFRSRPAYKYSVEHSVYIRKDQRGRGLGRFLLTGLIERAKQENLHTLVGGIDSTNVSSIRLHLNLGFAHCGSIKQAGFKFGRWLDLEFYQLILSTPNEPRDG